MGALTYGDSGITVSFDDRALMHLQIVISAKLRRRESFLVSWNDTIAAGGGRSSIWIDPASTLYFRYFGSRIPVINRNWIDSLMLSANSAGGLVLVAETPQKSLSQEQQHASTLRR